MACARIRTIELLHYCSPGEWGKLLGLDRIPEGRTLREKVRFLADGNQAAQWSGELSRTIWACFQRPPVFSILTAMFVFIAAARLNCSVIMLRVHSHFVAT